MKKIILILTVLLFACPATGAFAYKILYAEQFYKLYHSHYIQYPEDSAENIYYLENALKRPFVNPLNAIGLIKNEKQWERYRRLFYLHVNLKLIEQYRLLAVKYDKFDAYFFNYPWKQENLRSLQMAELYYKDALYYWDRVLEQVEAMAELPYLYIEGIEYWEDELMRIKSGQLDYEEFIGDDLKRLYEVRDKFEKMTPETY
ncbi:MAG: hypothetical protein JEZ04_19415 [Spirochaetales bacterium]|nr:hypothetical protein [Spirochaetales bacterium]